MPIWRKGFRLQPGVTSITTDSNPVIRGDVELDAGVGIILSQSGQVITIATSIGSRAQASLSDNVEYSLLNTTEVVVAEWNVRASGIFDDNTNVTLNFGCIAKRSGGGTSSTIRIRTGGTVGAADGTVRATVTVTAGAFTQGNDTAAAINLAALGTDALVKITLENDNATGLVTARGFSIVLSG